MPGDSRPPKPKKVKRNGTSSRNSISNGERNEEMESNKEMESQPQKMKIPKPIFAATNDVKKLQAELFKNTEFSEKPMYKRCFNYTQIITSSAADKQKVTAGLTEKKLDFYTFPEPSQKPKIFVMKGYLYATPEEILSDLQKAEIKAKVTYLMNPSNPYFMSNPLYMVHFEKDTDLNVQLLNRQNRYIINMVVSWEPLRKQIQRLTQCYRCQRFGHSSSRCGFLVRCVKCNESHEKGACKRTDNKVPGVYCVNCKGNDHPSNSPTCPEYKKEMEKREKILQRQRPRYNPAM